MCKKKTGSRTFSRAVENFLQYSHSHYASDPAPSLATPKGAIPHRHVELLRWQVDRDTRRRVLASENQAPRIRHRPP